MRALHLCNVLVWVATKCFLPQFVMQLICDEDNDLF